MPTGRIEDFMIPPALLAQIEAVADAEHRPVGEVLRHVIEQGLGERWHAHAEEERQRARDLGLPDDDVPLTAEYRQVLRQKIAEGVRSLREGRVVDGPTAMARLDAELAERERQHEGR